MVVLAGAVALALRCGRACAFAEAPEAALPVVLPSHARVARAEAEVAAVATGVFAAGSAGWQRSVAGQMLPQNLEVARQRLRRRRRAPLKH